MKNFNHRNTQDVEKTGVLFYNFILIGINGILILNKEKKKPACTV